MKDYTLQQDSISKWDKPESNLYLKACSVLKRATFSNLRMLSSIKTQITLSAITFVIGLSAALIFLVVQEHENLYRKSVSKNIQALSHNISEDLVEALASDTMLVDVTSLLLQLDAHENIVVAFVFDEEDQLLQAYQGSSFQSYERDFATFLEWSKSTNTSPNDHEELILKMNKVGTAGYHVGRFVVIADVSMSIEQARDSFVSNALPLGFLTVGVMGLLLIYGLRRQFSPVLKLTEFTSRVTNQRDYSARFPVTGNSEFSELGTGVNDMIETIVDELNGNIRKSNQLAEQQVEMVRLANFDSLTGLPNRQYVLQYLKKRLEGAEQKDADFAIIFLDLDGFKGINDTLGHDTGDKVLTSVANRLSRSIGEKDVLARLGGDEFLLVPENATDPEALIALSEMLVEIMKHPFQHKGLDLRVGLSAGVAFASDASFDVSKLIAFADIAMYESKKAGREKVTFFRPEMMDDQRRKLEIANSIIAAIENNEFKVLYQPKVNSAGEVVGFEGLIRWFKPNLGWISPAEFIPVSERGGTIHNITEWLIGQVFSDAVTLVDKFGPQLRIALNLSAHDLLNRNLINIIDSQLERTQINPQNIEFEVTESACLENFEETNALFKILTGQGFHVALDDFGTGFSSLGYLSQINVNTLKIDKQFVQGFTDSARTLLVTRTILDLAKRLKLTVCAEGIETEHQMQILTDEGCHQLQGFLFSKPIPMEKVMQLQNTIPADAIAVEK